MFLKSKKLMLASAFLATSFFAGNFNAFAQETPKLPDLNMENQQEKVDPSHVIAVINDKEITAGDLDKIAQSLNPEFLQLPADQRFAALIQYYVDSLALTEASDKVGLDKTPEYASMMNEARVNVLQRLYFQKEIVDKISDADLKARYDEIVASIPREDEVRARHILVPTQEEAKKIIAELDKGAKFEDIAKKISIDTGSSTVGGDLGYFTKNQMVKDFSDAAFALKPGTYTKEPVETPFGWHVIYVEDHRQKQLPAFDDMKDELRNFLARETFQKTALDLRKNVKVEYKDPDVEKAVAAHSNDTNEDMGDLNSAEPDETAE